MTLHDKYLSGAFVEVYDEIYSLQQEALSPDNFVQTNLVLTETFKRVSFNLNIIYKELKKTDYQFTADIRQDWQRPLLPPDPNVDLLLSELKNRTKNNGHIPLSLAYFYKIVGSCNFAGIGNQILAFTGKELTQSIFRQ